MGFRVFAICLFWLFGISAFAQAPTFDTNFPGGQCVPVPVVFSNTTTGIVGLEWSVTTPAGTYSDTTQTLVATYVASGGAGTWTATLFVTYANGDTASTTETFYLYSPPQITAVYVSDTNGCAPLDVCFIPNILGGSFPQSYLWDFGDSSTTTILMPCHTFTELGCHDVTLSVIDVVGCTAVTTFENLVCIEEFNSDFIADVTYAACPPVIVNFENLTPGIDSGFFATAWYYGNIPLPSTTTDGFYVFTEPGCYDITMIVVDANGCIDTVFKPCYIEVGGPFADVTTVIDNACSPVTACFTLDSTNSISFLFCPDNTTTCIPGPLDSTCITYDSIGIYEPTILICDNVGCCYEKQLGPIYVDSVNAAFTVPSASVCGSTAIQFTNASYSALGTFFSNWEFGDGNTSDELHPSHFYADTGCYDVTLIATGLGGCADTIESLDVVCVLQQAVAEITSPNASACDTPHTVCFNNATVNPPFTSYSWTFDGGNTLSSNLDSPCVDYQNPGTFAVELIASAPNGCTDTAVISNFVNIGIALANLTASDTFVTVGDTIEFLIAPFGTSSTWTITPLTGIVQIGTPAMDNELLFLQVGTYEVCAAITIPGGCTAEDCITITVNDTLDSTNPLFYEESFVHLQPNPASHQVTLNIRSKTADNGLVNVFTLEGKLLSSREQLFHQGVNELKLDVSGLPNGIYMLQVISKGFTANRKLVIQR